MFHHQRWEIFGLIEEAPVQLFKRARRRVGLQCGCQPSGGFFRAYLLQCAQCSLRAAATFVAEILRKAAIVHIGFQLAHQKNDALVGGKA